jgi:AcrR family transcriptional regulator
MSTATQPPVTALRDRPNARGDATRLSILLAAEALFAERGIEAVPLREIGQAAGQRNNVAVQYHFGDRDELLRALLTYRATESRLRRAEMLEEVIGSDQPTTLEDLVGIYVQSLRDHLTPESHYLAFLSRYITERGGYRGFEGAVSDTAMLRMQPMISALLPHLSAGLCQERWTLVMTSTVHALARYQVLQRSGELPAPIDQLIDDLILVETAGLSAKSH